ncbi:MAG: KpsF/GutQ family sugar-phosphate isomerase [Flavobacteriales bacterium]|nr:KpsF/GutQ family sugar-phosphate isomerase [Flavobacteriales bacterium]
MRSQANAIVQLENQLTYDFVQAVEMIAHAKGRFIITGIGKSAIIAQKIVATLNSTGTPSLFMHAAEAIHGDLGVVQPQDVVMCISKSGNSPEIKMLLPILKKFGNQLIGMTGNLNSFLAKQSDVVLDTTVEKESCPNNLAPTNSTTAQLVMGDCLAVCLMHVHQFTAQDFAKYHPGGALGKKLLFTVQDILNVEQKPQVTPETPIQKAIFEISEKRLGVTAVLENELVVGIITDGDIRRMLSRTETITGIVAKDVMTKNPKMISSSTKLLDALHLMEDLKITQLVVVDNQKYQGIIHLHDILKEGIER